MRSMEREQLIRMIRQAKVISFDVFDTLLYRKVNTPETVFDLVGDHFGIHGFRALRKRAQDQASRRVYEEKGYPHANFDEIYERLAEHTEIPVDWAQVKAYELQLEQDAQVANPEMLEIYRIARKQNKRVIAVSDMYLSAGVIEQALMNAGYEPLDHVYCSADERHVKFDKTLFAVVAQKEHTEYSDILHIGDNPRDDGEYPAEFGIKTFIYERSGWQKDFVKKAGTQIDDGLCRILCGPDDSFWHRLGVQVGGPLYLGLYRWLEERTRGRRLFFLSRDGYNLYQICKEMGWENVSYLYVSRRSLLLASVEDLNEQEIAMLPPYACGQTVGEILDYLCIKKQRIHHLREAGFHTMSDVIRTEEDIQSFRKLYTLDRDAFLERCREERANALQYLSDAHLFEEDAACFDCGWQGSQQYLLEALKRAAGIQTEHVFYYVGIRSTKKSMIQLRGIPYEAYLFDHHRGYDLQRMQGDGPTAMYELFFSAPHGSVHHYEAQGRVVFEKGDEKEEQKDLLRGIRDYLDAGMSFAQKYGVEITARQAAGQVCRLIEKPTEEEAKRILVNDKDICWPQGLLRRADIPEDIKKKTASEYGIPYPEKKEAYHLEDPESIRNYTRWRRNQAHEKDERKELKTNPFFSVVIPVYNTKDDQLRTCIDSVLAQDYHAYELILVEDHSTWDNVRPLLRSYENREHVRVHYRTENGNISEATNDGIRMASGEFIVFMDCDDLIEPDALYQFARMLNENSELDFIYSDEDKVTEDGKLYHMPFFKPDWSPDLFLNMMYTNHLAMYRASIVREIGGLRTAYNGSQDYDMTLRFMEHSDNRRVGHIAKVLYHWREREESVAFATESKDYTIKAAREAKEDYIIRNRLSACLEPVDETVQYRIRYLVNDNPLISIIIPSKDHPELLRACLHSISKNIDGFCYELIIVDNGSNKQNRELIKENLASFKARYIYKKQDFNFSRMCNTGARAARGQYLLFLNDDIEMVQPDGLNRMLGHAQQAHVGAVGCKLLFPNSSIIQHDGVLSITYGPVNELFKWNDSNQSYMSWNRVNRNCLAVTGACMLIKTTTFWEVGGFDEALPVAYNDVALCYDLVRNGYYNVLRNDVVAYHHESLSRGNDLVDEQKYLRLQNDRMYLEKKYPEYKGKDPFLNEHLHTWSNTLDLKDNVDQLHSITINNDGVVEGQFCVDEILFLDQIHIYGWSFHDAWADGLRRSILLKDPYGQIYEANTLSVERQDLVDYYHDERYRYCGFEAVLNSTDLRMDLYSYQQGMRVEVGSGNTGIIWGQESIIYHDQTPISLVKGYQVKKYDSSGKRIDTAISDPAIHWSLDECEPLDLLNGYKFRGYAFHEGSNHLDTCQVVLIGPDENALVLDTGREERLDVSLGFPQEHFLFQTGFVCHVFEDMLPGKGTYEILIRLQNRSDPTIIYDIRTDRQLTI